MTPIIVVLIIAVTSFMSVSVWAFVVLKMHKDFEEKAKARQMDFNSKLIRLEDSNSKRTTFRDYYKK